jgi:hypothetical protein
MRVSELIVAAERHAMPEDVNKIISNLVQLKKVERIKPEGCTSSYDHIIKWKN